MSEAEENNKIYRFNARHISDIEIYFIEDCKPSRLSTGSSPPGAAEKWGLQIYQIGMLAYFSRLVMRLSAGQFNSPVKVHAAFKLANCWICAARLISEKGCVRQDGTL
jgi:hypothetical protein